MNPSLTVHENLSFWRSFAGRPSRTISEALSLVRLGSAAGLPFAYLSAGQRRRVAIARLLMNFRPLWLLDEPATGLDEASKDLFAGIMRAHLGDGGIIVAATHEPLRFETTCRLRLGDPR